MTAIKRHTTPNIIIEVKDVNMDDITEVMFAVKNVNDETAPLLFPIKNVVRNTEPECFLKIDDKSFNVMLKLTKEETLKIPKGRFFIDVLPVAGAEMLNAGPPLEMEALPTFFGGVDNRG